MRKISPKQRAHTIRKSRKGQNNWKTPKRDRPINWGESAPASEPSSK